MSIFGMVTTRDSWEYTSYALKSFFRNTKLSSEDKVILIDNDKFFEEEGSWFSPKLEIIKNEEPKSFAANVNYVMNIAKPLRADLFFLNNDLIFTEDWINPLLLNEPTLLSPLSNREVQYEKGGVIWRNVMKLSEYLGKESFFKEVVKEHKATTQGYRKVIFLPFFCIKIPFQVYEKLGPLDEAFLKGGAEDNDYCLRAYQEGFEVKYAAQSYILHFSGKSTWAGGETSQQTEERCRKFREVFRNKWGTKLERLVIDFDMNVLNEDPSLKEFAQSEDYKSLIEALNV